MGLGISYTSRVEPQFESSRDDGRGRRWDAHNADRQARIIRAAIDLIEEQPARAEIPIQDIANRAGLAKSVVYRQFDRRDELDRRIRRQISDDVLERITASMDFSQGSFHDVIRRSVAVVAVWAAEHVSQYETLRSGPVTSGSKSDALAVLRKRTAERIDSVRVMLAQTLDLDLDPLASLGFAVVTMVEGTLAHWVRDSTARRTREQIIDEISAYVWFLIEGAARSLDIELDPTVSVIASIAEISAKKAGVEVVNEG